VSRINLTAKQHELAVLCHMVRKLVGQEKYRECELMIRKAMGKYPHAPEPHNLMGILLAEEGDQITAMKHFRAAWALDPTYIPARYNLERFGSFYPQEKYAFDETDCHEGQKKDLFKVEYDQDGIGHVVRKD